MKIGLETEKCNQTITLENKTVISYTCFIDQAYLDLIYKKLYLPNKIR
jgi:hypothetical protein